MVDLAQLDDATLASLNSMMGKKPEPEGFDAFRDLIPAYGRVQVPLCDKAALREAARILAALAQQLELLSGRHDLTQTQVLFYSHREIKSANGRLQDATRYRNQK